MTGAGTAKGIMQGDRVQGKLRISIVDTHCRHVPRSSRSMKRVRLKVAYHIGLENKHTRNGKHVLEKSDSPHIINKRKKAVGFPERKTLYGAMQNRHKIPSNHQPMTQVSSLYEMDELVVPTGFR